LTALRFEPAWLAGQKITRRRAARAEADAAQMSLSLHKEQLLSIASQWRTLVRQARELDAEDEKRRQPSDD
jgi:hypothetical protein